MRSIFDASLIFFLLSGILVYWSILGGSFNQWVGLIQASVLVIFVISLWVVFKNSRKRLNQDAERKKKGSMCAAVVSPAALIGTLFISAISSC
jgi:Ca2+/Na+ antiporter